MAQARGRGGAIVPSSLRHAGWLGETRWPSRAAVPFGTSSPKTLQRVPGGRPPPPLLHSSRCRCASRRAGAAPAARRLVWKDLGLYRAVRTDAPEPQSAGEALLGCSGALWLASRGGGRKPGVRLRLGTFGDITAKRAARLAISDSCACACVQACPVPARPRLPRRRVQSALRNALSRSCYPASPTLAVA